MLQGLAQLPNGLSIRPARPADKPLLKKLIDDKYSALKQTTDLGRDQIENLMEIQVTAQNSAYGGMFPNAAYFVVEKTGQAIGKLTLDWDGERAHVVDLGFIAKAQGKGYGQTIIEALLGACGQAKCPLSLACATQDAALLRFLVAHGFVARGPVDPQASHVQLLWTPDATAMQS
jgi:GNAT superfamily N-acetyltransferase